MRAGSCPRRYSQINGEAFRFLHLKADGGFRLVGILRVLHQRAPRAVLFPAELRRNIEVYIDAIRRAEVGTDAIVRGDLGKCSRTTGPLILVIELGSRVVIVRIIKACAAGKNRCSAEDGVVQNTLHAVAIPAVSRDAHEIAGNLEMAVRTAGGLKA